jgi:hypothetical protein
MPKPVQNDLPAERLKAREKYMGVCEPILTTTSMEGVPVASTGYIGLNRPNLPQGVTCALHPLDYLIGERSEQLKFKRLRWNGL